VCFLLLFIADFSSRKIPHPLRISDLPPCAARTHTSQQLVLFLVAFARASTTVLKFCISLSSTSIYASHTHISQFFPHFTQYPVVCIRGLELFGDGVVTVDDLSLVLESPSFIQRTSWRHISCAQIPNSRSCVSSVSPLCTYFISLQTHSTNAIIWPTLGASSNKLSTSFMSTIYCAYNVTLHWSEIFSSATSTHLSPMTVAHSQRLSQKCQKEYGRSCGFICEVKTRFVGVSTFYRWHICMDCLFIVQNFVVAFVLKQ